MTIEMQSHRALRTGRKKFRAHEKFRNKQKRHTSPQKPLANSCASENKNVVRFLHRKKEEKQNTDMKRGSNKRRGRIKKERESSGLIFLFAMTVTKSKTGRPSLASFVFGYMLVSLFLLSRLFSNTARFSSFPFLILSFESGTMKWRRKPCKRSPQ